MNMLKKLSLPLSLILFLGSDQLKAGAIPGTLDLSFGGDNTGYVTFDDTPKQIYWQSIAIKPSGNIVVAGSDGVNGIVAQYKPNGTLDSSFGDHNGYTLLTANSANIKFSSVTITPNGNIVVAGLYGANGIVAQYKPDGKLDSSFGDHNGYTLLTLTNVAVQFSSVAIIPSGNIVVVGYKIIGEESDFTYYYGIVAQYKPNGMPDLSFGDDNIGYAIFDGNNIQWESIAITSSGNIVVAGSSDDVNGIVAQYKPNGMLDQSFGDHEGYTLLAIESTNVYFSSVKITPSGNIVVAGESGSSGIVAQYKPNGTLDSSFGDSNGYTLLTVTNASVQFSSVAITDNGSIAVAGIYNSSEKGIVAQYKQDGTLDTANFNADSATPGYVIFTTVKNIPNPINPLIYLNSVAIDLNGNIVVAGSSGPDGVVARYFGAYSNTPTGLVEKYSGINLGLLGGIAKVN